jgi:tetratricopeptide (TPR) repeat protein
VYIVDKDIKIATLVGIFTIFGAILGAYIPIFYSSITTSNDIYWTNKGNEYAVIHDFNDAVKCYDNAINLNPHSVAWEYKAYAFFNSEKYNESIPVFESATKLYPKDPTLRFMNGMALLYQEKYDQAVEAFDEAIKLEPNYENAWFMKGEALAKLKKYDQAVEAYDKGFEINPRYDAFWYNRSRLYRALSH